MRNYLFSFKGRATRAQYWSVSCLLTSVWLLLVVWAKYFTPSFTVTQLIFTGIMIAGFVGIIWSGIANHVKRFHDMDRSGWWTLLIILPFVGMLVSLIWLGFFKGTDSDNRFGAAEPDISTKKLVVLVVGAFLLAMMAGCVAGFREGMREAEKRKVVYTHEGAVVQPVTQE